MQGHARSLLATAAIGCAIAGSSPASLGASAAVDQVMRLGDSDPTAALAILEQADAAGDAEASAVLAATLFFAPAPRTNRARACAIAQRLAGVQNADGWALLASCQLTGTVAAADRFDAARASARRAIRLGSANGGTALFTAYSVDPRYSAQGADGRPDRGKVAMLAAQPIEQRTIQAEAWTGLSHGLDRGDAMASTFAIAALAEVSAPGNLGRLLAVAERFPAAARRFAGPVASARSLQSLGGTHASIKAALDAQRAALPAAAWGVMRDSGTSCDSFALARTDPGAPPEDAVYLPVALGPLVNAYLVSGHWQERWTFAGCGREVAIQISFKADGLGGATFEASAPPRSVVLKTP